MGSLARNRARLGPWRSGSWLLGVLLPLAACGDEIGLPPDDLAVVRYPIALAAEPSGRFVYAVGANFDRSFRAGVLRVVDTANDTFLPGARVEVPAFAGGIALQIGDAPGVGARGLRAFVPARNDDSLTTVDLGAAATPTLGCGKVDKEGRCAPEFRLGGTEDDPVGNDPLDAHVSPGGPGRMHLHVVATTSGEVTVLDFDAKTPPGQAPDLALVGRLDLLPGLSAAVTSPLTGVTYVTNTRSNEVAAYRVRAAAETGGVAEIVRETSILVPSGGGPEFGRGVALSSDGGQVYAAWRSPAAVAILDVAPGRPRLSKPAVVDFVPVGTKPAAVAVAPTGPDGRDLVYVSCFGDDAVWVVDPLQRTVVSVIELEHAPYALATANVPGQGWRLYVALFNKHKIAVVPLDPGAPGRHTATHAVGVQP